MSYLFIDSTYDLILGVLDDGFNWLSFERHTGAKASAIIQARSHDLLSQNNIKLHELKGIITVNGPGFYTGLRLAEGFADVLKFFGIPQYSFYSYEIPAWCGHTEGCWFTKAYRGEYFLYRWKEEESRQELMAAKDLEHGLGDERFFIHSESSLDEKSTPFVVNPVMTMDLLKTRPHDIFKRVVDSKGQRESFYFRAPEDEFKVNP